MGLARSTRAKPRLSQIETNTVMESAAERLALRKNRRLAASKDKSPFPRAGRLCSRSQKNTAAQAIVP